MLSLAAYQSVCAHDTGDEPDISAVWMGFAADPPGRFAPFESKLSATGRAGVEAFKQTYGEDYPDPGSYCVPQGLPSVMVALVTYPIEIIQHPGQITMLAEMEMQVRRIYMDGREHPANYPHTRIGHSIGHWDGDTLIIDTTLLQEWKAPNWPHTRDTRIRERIYLTTRDKVTAPSAIFVSQEPLDDEVLVVELTLTDPATYIEPLNVTVYYQKVSDDNILEYDCPVELWLEELEEHRTETGR
jgi:hypothetical protein